MDTTDEHELSICADCLMLVANDDTTALDDAEADALRQAFGERWAGYHVHPACEEGCEGAFSWSSCDGCGSTLGGERHPAVAFKVGK